MKYPQLHYNDYIHIDQLTKSQKLRSEEYGHKAHDEMLFIIVHQAYELWFKQILWELDSVLDFFKQNKVEENQIGTATHRLQRVVQILRHVLGQIDILETMSPMDFLDFREFLYPASGFQSFQFRMIETKLGLKTEDRVSFTQSAYYNLLKPEQKTEILKALDNDTLFTAVEKWLERMPFVQFHNYSFWKEYQSAVRGQFQDDIDIIQSNPRLNDEEKMKNTQMMQGMAKMAESIFDETSFAELKKNNYFTISYKAVQSALMIQLYRDETLFQAPYRFMLHLLDIDELLTQWRHRHALMAHRMLGKKIGTGGSSGHDYLKSAAEKHKIFTDYFNLSTFLIPRSRMPKLPEELKAKLNF